MECFFQFCYDIGPFRFIRNNDADPLKIERVSLPWGYFDWTMEANFYIRDYQGNVRTVFDQFNYNFVQKTDYYPYGLPKATSTNPSANRFKCSGKELETDLYLTHYDFEARMQLPTLGLFQRPDPKAGDFPWLNPYTYCAADPINKVDPSGEDATILFDGKMITVFAVVYLMGPKATDEIARLFKDDIKEMWGKIEEFSYEGETYDVNWDVDVRVKGNEQVDYNGVNNYMEVYDKRSNVIDTNHGYIRGIGREGRSLKSDSPMSHEFGHMLGLSDKYEKDGSIPAEWENDIMAEPTHKSGRTVSKSHSDKLFTPIVQKRRIDDIMRNFPVISRFIPDVTVYKINNDTRPEPPKK